MNLSDYEDIFVTTVYRKDTHVYFDIFTIEPKETHVNKLEVKHNKKVYNLHTHYEISKEHALRLKENFINQLYNLER